MTASRTDGDLTLLLNAYLDGELDPIAARAVEERLAREPAAARQLSELHALRLALRSDLAEDVPSERLQQRIASIAGQPDQSWIVRRFSLVRVDVLLEHIARNLRVGSPIVGRVIREPVRDRDAKSCGQDQESEKD